MRVPAGTKPQLRPRRPPLSRPPRKARPRTPRITEPDGNTRQPAPHLHPAPQPPRSPPPRSPPGDAGPARARRAERHWGGGKPRTCEATAGAGRAVRGSLGRKKAPRARGKQAPPPAARPEPAGVARAARRLGQSARARPSVPAAVLTSVEAAGFFRAPEETEDRWVRCLPIPDPWRVPGPGAVQSAAAAEPAARSPQPAEPDIGAARRSRRCERRSGMRASLAGPGPPVTTQPTSSSRGNAALQPRMRFDVKEGAKTRPLLTQAQRTASSPPPSGRLSPLPPAPNTPLPTSFKANTSSRVRAPLRACEIKPVPNKMTRLRAQGRREIDTEVVTLGGAG